ncbi:unnamed protein product [Acanthoscelides obtectus]|uniref:Uncharacterized protein n=1 Tax=Acanthoscelides obtectus TaxID=200917 RepID=A0A9P0KHS3_ACAOB|nr:unnamed protein product [Acanthoscelides obtectus]CAK1625652.1 hypothetical protein AOBTE_LOCUS3309 [Acanthoscelides obtectus]
MSQTVRKKNKNMKDPEDGDNVEKYSDNNEELSDGKERWSCPACCKQGRVTRSGPPLPHAVLVQKPLLLYNQISLPLPTLSPLYLTNYQLWPVT